MKKIPYIARKLLEGMFYVFLLTVAIWFIQDLAKYSFLFWLILVIPLLIIFCKAINHYDNTWLKGLIAETDMQNELKKLPNGYVFVKNIETAKNGNIDYVVLGPNGVWSIEVKSHSGSIEFDDQRLLHNKRPFEKDILKQALYQKEMLEEYIRTQLGIAFPVKPMIVFSSPKAYLKLGMKPCEGVYVIQKRWLLNLIIKSNDVSLSKNTMYGIISILKPLAKTLFVPTVYEIKKIINNY